MSPDSLTESLRQTSPEASTISEIFSLQVARTPDSVAVISGDRKLTFRELDRRSSVLAAHLQALGAGPETVIGIAIERSEALLIGLLGILKSGSAYVPLDPDFPAERLSWILEDSAMRMIVTSGTTQTRLALNSSTLELIDAESFSDADSPLLSPLSRASGSNLAYIMYTSGSTGKPKGVMVENRNVVNFFNGMDQAIGCAPGVWLAVTSISFDISVLELFWTLTRGFTVVLIGKESPAVVADQISRCRVTHLQMTPSLARMLALDARAFLALGSLKQLLLGGEAVPVSLIQQIRTIFKGEIYNMYGPTETTIWSTTCKVNEPGETVPIGRPILNTQIYLLDAQMNPVPPGEIGELFIAGDGVARGYWNLPDLTRERFLSIPPVSLHRLYRTGDLVRCMPDGNLEFLGRVDNQIKLRGHRIELGEIETALEQHPGILQAIITLREDRPGDKRLVAYLVGQNSAGVAAEELRKYLASRLPEVMVPSIFVFLPELPLTANGKIDRKALLTLPPPGSAATAEIAQHSQRPASEMEQTVARLWQEALGVPRVGIDDNFFDLGAHSLTVAEVQARLRDVLGREVDLVDLFQFSTVKTLSAHLAGAQASNVVSDRALRRRLARQ
jgi:amino acid adenylation domain-containing protein